MSQSKPCRQYFPTHSHRIVLYAHVVVLHVDSQLPTHENGTTHGLVPHHRLAPHHAENACGHEWRSKHPAILNQVGNHPDAFTINH
ncbi:hypothetical protein TNIN_438081 [Trichonephila inaurata madagascariensis]|uniref:Uncharacterized protein n=1 Tax=Trichonephila inaurata madagascariensis TaxID=2747483 RepID=A0A8X6YGP2_9ARAC|nr:hypothetical protein TNIN_438081 [Trichonephila inaurata madagascariensis]